MAARRLGASAGCAPRHDRLKAESGDDNDYSSNTECHPPGQPLMNQQNDAAENKYRS
jgi:hypothetical protein